MGRSVSRQLDPVRRPQLVGPSRAAQQARRAAGIILDADHYHINTENEHPKTNFVSVRSIIRKMARRNGCPPSQLSAVSAWARNARRIALKQVKEK